MMSRIAGVLFALVLVGSATAIVPSYAQQPANDGLVGVKSRWNAYLQSHTDGELHASNMKRNEEETWFLVTVDKSKQIYGLYNWRTGMFLTRTTDPKGCARAESAALGPAQQWYMMSGKPYQVVNAVYFRSVFDNTVLGAYPPGHDDDGGCGGEVTARDPWPANTIPHDSAWGGWWILEAATPPSPGKDFWNTVGGSVQGILNKVSAADIAAIITALQ